MWTDIGVNLSAKQFAPDRAEVVARARAAGVETLVLTGTSVADSAVVLQLAEQHQQYATVGVHPHHASDWNADSASSLRTLASHPRACAIGECGLDFNRNFSTPADQERAFVAQLALAAELGKPVFLHCREAQHRLLPLLVPFLTASQAKLPGAVLHCFTGTRAELIACTQHGLYVGITGWICDERRGTDLLAMLSLIASDRLLLETDAPWLLPRDLAPAGKNRRNEPAYLPHIGAVVARQLGVTVEQLAQQTSANAKRLFHLP